MFERNTVFLTGAGASAHFGYPTNNQLLNLVQQTAQQLWQYSIKKTSSFPMPEVVARLREDNSSSSVQQSWRDFNNACMEIVNRINLLQPIVIDDFLRNPPARAALR
jgi:NAD-dependent SIR2 family protein deacetylase